MPAGLGSMGLKGPEGGGGDGGDAGARGGGPCLRPPPPALFRVLGYAGAGRGNGAAGRVSGVGGGHVRGAPLRLPGCFPCPQGGNGRVARRACLCSLRVGAQLGGEGGSSEITAPGPC